MEKIFGVLGFQTQEVSIIFASDGFVKRLNKQYRHLDQPTDVLAFPMQEGEWTEIQPQLLGDVVISVDTASKQAQEMGHSLDKELAILLTHGILHLTGYDHIHDEDAQKMRHMEQVILNKIGPL